MTDREWVVRTAKRDDAPAIARIYNQGIEDRTATFETEPRTVAQIEAQMRERGAAFPAIVVEREGGVIAWAGAAPYSNRPAYAGVAAHSVYVAREARGRGAGRAALVALCDAYEARGFWKLASRIFPENAASLALHERAGFRIVGTYRRHGKLDGEWRDCVIVEKLLGEAADKAEG
jgi:L-amino acid N-acyltransferase YncA